MTCRHGVRHAPCQLDPDRRLQQRRGHLQHVVQFLRQRLANVMITKIICDIYGWELEVVSPARGTAWSPGVQSGIYDAVIAGQSMTADRMAQVDMARPHYYAADIVIVTTKDI